MVIAKANGQALGEESCRGGTASPHDSAVEPAAAPSLRDQAYEVLEELITLRVLPAGSLLSETSLSKKARLRSYSHT